MKSSPDQITQRSLIVIIISLVIIVMFLFVMITNGLPTKKQTSTRLSCKKSELDNYSKRMLMITDKNFRYPVTLGEMNKHCKEMKTAEKYIRHYLKKCSTSNLQRKSFSLLIYGASKTNKALCRSIKRRRAFAAFGQSCANRLQKTLNSYFEDMNRALFAILSYPVQKLRIPLSCCNYYKFKNRALQMYIKECPEHASKIDRLLKGFTQDSFTFICSSYMEDSDKCSRIINKTPSSNKTLKTEAFVSTYINMIDNFVE